MGIDGTVYAVKDDDAVHSADVGVAGGIAELDNTGRVPSSQLPSYVDDVLEYASLSVFPVTGESGKIYIALDTNKQYRWSGTEYVEISSSLALGETSSTAYRGDRGKIAYDHSQTIGNPHGTTVTGLSDTEIVSAETGQLLKYDAVAGKWKNAYGTNSYEIIEVTWLEYLALTPEQKADPLKEYMIKDYPADGESALVGYEVTQAQYEALTPEQKSNPYCVFFIKDYD